MAVKVYDHLGKFDYYPNAATAGVVEEKLEVLDYDGKLIAMYSRGGWARYVIPTVPEYEFFWHTEEKWQLKLRNWQDELVYSPVQVGHTTDADIEALAKETYRRDV